MALSAALYWAKIRCCSTFAPERSPWLRKNLVQRLHKDTGLPVEHVVLQEEVPA